MAPNRRVLLRDRGIGGDVAVEKVVGEGAQQISYPGGKLGQIGQHRLAQEDVRARSPGMGGHRQ